MSDLAHPSASLAAFAASLRHDDIPQPVMARAEDLFVDWTASALAGRFARPVQIIADFASAMGPTQGESEILMSGRSTTPYLAAMVNGAASHVAEQDDVHNGSVFHPAAVVFPAALAVAQARGASGKEFLTACVVGYEVGIRIGEFLGRSHYEIFHTTGTAGAVAAAAAAGHLLRLNAGAMLHAFGSAGTQAAGLWEFLRDAADSKPLHTGRAAANGVMSAFLAEAGFTGASHILEGPQGMAAGMSRDADPVRLVDGLGTRWATAETSFKFLASCRHTHPAADALQKVMFDHGLQADDIASVETLVHQGAIDVLGRVTVPTTVHQAKFSMGTTLALIAVHGKAGMAEFDASLDNPAVSAFRDRVTMTRDPEVDAAYPARWIGKVRVITQDGRTLEARVDEPKGDPGNTLSRAEIDHKFIALAAYGGSVDADGAAAVLPGLWSIRDRNAIGRLMDRPHHDWDNEITIKDL